MTFACMDNSELTNQVTTQCLHHVLSLRLYVWDAFSCPAAKGQQDESSGRTRRHT
jgi:hypothetical protein